MLGERVVPLYLKAGLAAARDAMKEDRLLDRGDERVPYPGKPRVVWPDRQLVLSALRQPPRVIRQMALGVIDVEPERVGDGGVQPPATRLDVFGRDERIRGRVPALRVDQPDRVEHLHRVVGVKA